MNEQDHRRPGTEDTERDALGTIIRAAGRRPTPRDEHYREVFAASRAAWQSKLRSRRRRRIGFALAASLAAAGVVIASLVSLQPRDAVAFTARVEGRTEIMPPDARAWRLLDAGESGLVPGTRLRTASDARLALDLVRGASLRIDGDTTLTLESAELIALLGGALYLDTGLGVRTAPFEIATGYGSVRDIGTQFEVASREAGLRIRVREGRVQIDRGRGATEIEGLEGEEILVRGSGGVERTALASDDPVWAWVDALAPAQQIDGRSAFEILSWVARETGRSLRFEDAAAERQARSSILRGGDQALTPAEALEVAATTSALAYRIEAGVILVRRR